MKKENFITILSSLTQEEISEFIQKKGKEPKLIAPFIILPEEKIKNKKEEA